MFYSGKLSELYKLFIKNILLTFLTLGIYRFWGKTNVRKYICSHTEINNSPLHFHGTAIELIKGFLIALVPYLFFVGLISLHNGIISIILIIIIMFLIYVSFYGHLRYILTRTSLNGIHFNYSMNIFKSARYTIMYATLNTLSLFIFDHYFTVKKNKVLYNYIEYGDLKGSLVNVHAGNIQRMHYITYFLSFFTFGLSRLYFKSYVDHYFLSNYYMGQTQIKALFTPKQLFIFNLKNIFLIVFTLGLAFPYVLHRLFVFNTKYIDIKGPLFARPNENIDVNIGHDSLSNIFDTDIV